MDKGHPLFDTGYVIRTFEAFTAMVISQTSEWSLIERHQRGDFGDVSAERRKSNLSAVNEETGRVFSSYLVRPNVPVWIITRLDGTNGCVTTLMLPHEFPFREGAPRRRARAGSAVLETTAN